MTTKILKSMIVIMTALFSTIVMAQVEDFLVPKASDSDILIIQVNKKPTFTIEVDSTKNTEATVSSSNFFKLYCAKEVELTAPVTLTVELMNGATAADSKFVGTWTLPKGKIVKNQKIDGKITLPKEISAENPYWFKGKISFSHSNVDITGDDEGVQALTDVLFDPSDFLGDIEMKISKSSFNKSNITEQYVFFKTKRGFNFIDVPKNDKVITAELSLNEPAEKDVTFDITTSADARKFIVSDTQITIYENKKSAKVKFTVFADSVKELDLFNKNIQFYINATVVEADSDIFTPAELNSARIYYDFKDQQSKYIKGTMTATVDDEPVDVKTPLNGSDTLLLSFDFATTKSAIITNDKINANIDFNMEIKFNGPVKTVSELEDVFSFSKDIFPIENSKGEINGVFTFNVKGNDTTLLLTVIDPSEIGKYSFALVNGYTNNSDVKFKASGKTTITVEPIKEIQVATASAATTLTFVNSGKKEDVSGYGPGVLVEKGTADDLTMKTNDNNQTGVVTVITDKKVLKGYIGVGIVEGVKGVVGPKEFNLTKFTKAPAFFLMAHDPIKDKLEYGKSKKYASKTTFTKDTATVIVGKGPKAYNPSVLSNARKAGFFFTSIVDSEGVLPSVKDQAKATTKEIVYNYNQLVGAPCYIAIKEGKDGKAGYINISEKDALDEAPVSVCVFATPTIDTVKIDSVIISNGKYVKGSTDTVLVSDFEGEKITIEGSNFIGSKAKIILEYKNAKNVVVAKSINVTKDSDDEQLEAIIPFLPIGENEPVWIIIDNGSTLTPIKKQIIVE